MSAHSRQNGTTLIELLIGIVLVGAISMILAQAYKTLQKAQNYSSVKGETNDLTSYVNATLSCSNTFTAAVKTTCTAKTAAHNQYIDVKDDDGVTFIVVAQTSEVGNAYRLRAKCVDLNGFWGILVEYFRKSSGASAKSSIAQDTDTWTPLATALPFACPP